MQLFARTCHYEAMNVERIVARGFVIAGGLVWAVSALAAPYGNRTVSVLISDLNSVGLLVLTIAVFLLGWFYERLAALLLVVGAVGVIVYGVVTGWELGVWMYMGSVLIAPMLISGLLFALAARTERICELTEGSARPSSPGTQAPA